jgi:hypothetical protein
MAQCEGKTVKGKRCGLKATSDSQFCEFHLPKEEKDCGIHCGPTQPIENDIPDFDAEQYSCRDVVTYVRNVTGGRVVLNEGDGLERLIDQANEVLA